MQWSECESHVAALFILFTHSFVHSCCFLFSIFSLDILFISIMLKQFMRRMRNLFNCVYFIFSYFFFIIIVVDFVRVLHSHLTCIWWVWGRTAQRHSHSMRSLSLKFNLNVRVSHRRCRRFWRFLLFRNTPYCGKVLVCWQHSTIQKMHSKRISRNNKTEKAFLELSLSRKV